MKKNATFIDRSNSNDTNYYHTFKQKINKKNINIVKRFLLRFDIFGSRVAERFNINGQREFKTY